MGWFGKFTFFPGVEAAAEGALVLAFVAGVIAVHDSGGSWSAGETRGGESGAASGINAIGEYLALLGHGFVPCMRLLDGVPWIHIHDHFAMGACGGFLAWGSKWISFSDLGSFSVL